jgi:squalene monooxygenase
VEALKNGCFRYFQLGGTAISEPAGLLSGLIRNPLVLVYHFFSVAFYAVLCRLREEPAWKAPYIVTVESFMIVYTAAAVIGPYLVWEMKR